MTLLRWCKTALPARTCPQIPPFSCLAPPRHMRRMPFPMKAALLVLVSLLSVATLSAQNSAPSNNDEDTPTRDGLWEGQLKGGNYVVRANAIIALSKHEYIADAAARVVEVNISLSTDMV
eukprot:gene51974-63546_t